MTILTTVYLGEEGWLALEELAQACDVEPEWITQLVAEGLLEPTRTEPRWGFGGAALARTRRIHRLQRDFEASLPSVALMLDLLEEIDRLRSELHRAVG